MTGSSRTELESTPSDGQRRHPFASPLRSRRSAAPHEYHSQLRRHQEFEVAFSVRIPDGRTVEAKAKSEVGEAEVTFPDNFGIFGPVAHGVYKWTAKSDGALVGSDEFSQ